MSDSAPAAASVSEPTAAPAEPVPAPAPVDRRPRQQWKGRDAGPDDNELLLINYVKRATRKNLWYYRDRCGVARGPATLPTLREAWVHGLIDENTLCHGQGLVDFLPIKNIRTLTPQIRTWDGAQFNDAVYHAECFI